MTIKLPLLCLVLASTAAHAAPTWCGKTKPHAYTSVRDALGTDAGDALVGIYVTTCFPSGDDAQHAAEVEAARRTWSQRLGMTEADWADVADFAESDLGARRGLHIPTPAGGFPVKAWSALSPVEQFIAITEHRIDGDFIDPAYLADALGPHLTEAGRVAYVQQCLREERPIVWAMCTPDIVALDATKLGAELRGDREHAGFERMTVRLVLDGVRDQLVDRAAAIKALLAKDSAYAKLFAIAHAQHDAWVARWRDRADLVALAAAMDDASVTHSRKLSEGCGPKTEAAFTAAVAALPAKAFVMPHAGEQDIDEELAARIAGVIVADADGYLAATSRVLCGGGGAVIATLASTLDRWPGYRGPRTATATAILTAGIELDDRRARLAPPDAMRSWGRHHADRVGEAVVESVKQAGDKTTITYTKKPETITEGTGCTRTNRITQIRSDGTLVYEEHCSGTTTRVIDRRFPPATVDTSTATGVKRGALVAVGTGVVWAVWPKPTATTPAAVLGIAVK